MGVTVSLFELYRFFFWEITTSFLFLLEESSRLLFFIYRVSRSNELNISLFSVKSTCLDLTMTFKSQSKTYTCLSALSPSLTFSWSDTIKCKASSNFKITRVQRPFFLHFILILFCHTRWNSIVNMKSN